MEKRKTCEFCIEIKMENVWYSVSIIFLPYLNINVLFCRSSFLAGLAGAIASTPIDVVKVKIMFCYLNVKNNQLTHAAANGMIKI